MTTTRRPRLVRVTCSGCGKTCCLHGKTHPAVTTLSTYLGVAPVYHCERECFDRTATAGGAL